ncbi:MAG: hypothetical protein ACOCSN_01645 [Halanaeroarchaeum sp.]
MAYGNNPHETYSYRTVDAGNRDRFREALGLSVRTPDGPTLDSFSPDGTPAPDLAERGEAIREGLTGALDADLIATSLDDLATRIERVPELREIGCPERGQTPYQDLLPPAWELVDHLTAVGFFESAEEHLPAFTDDHIEATTEQLLRMESPTETLSALGIPDHEQLALVSNIVNASDQLGWWEHTADYPDVEQMAMDDHDEGIVHDYVPPLHRRAMEGSLVWIDGLDWHLWQKEVLITQEMIEKGVWDVKTMLAGVYLLGDAARRLANGEIADENLTTVITASTAMMVIGQEFLVDDVAWIDDDDRKPAEEW